MQAMRSASLSYSIEMLCLIALGSAGVIFSDQRCLGAYNVSCDCSDFFPQQKPCSQHF